MQAVGVLKLHQEDLPGHLSQREEMAAHLQTACRPGRGGQETMQGGGRSKQNRGD